MQLSGYMEAPRQSELLALIHGIKYLIQHPHEPIIYPKENNLKLNDIPHQNFFKVVSSEIKISNTPTFFTHIVTRITHKIFLTGALQP